MNVQYIWWLSSRVFLSFMDQPFLLNVCLVIPFWFILSNRLCYTFPPVLSASPDDSVQKTIIEELWLRQSQCNMWYIAQLHVSRFLVERALKLHPTAMLQPLTHEDGKSQIQVQFSELNINIIPACFLDHHDDIYLVSRPYSNDIDPTADALWRWSYFNKERRILARMANADRGARRRAFLCMKALIAEEHTLQGLTSYHVKTALMHCFDETVDSTPRWQRNTIDSCFITLLQELSMFLNDGVLPNFFLRSQNLLETMTPRLLATLKSRVGFLAQNHGEVRRILRKHCNNHHVSLLIT